jgi:hypothetical protein
MIEYSFIIEMFYKKVLLMLNEVKCPTKKVFFFNLKDCIFSAGRFHEMFFTGIAALD